MSARPESQLYDSPIRATSAEIDYVRGLGTHLLGGFRKLIHAVPITRVRLLLNYRRTLDDPRRDWGQVDVAKVRKVVEAELAEELRNPAVHIPTNGHGVFGARRYAQPVGEFRREIRRSGDGEE